MWANMVLAYENLPQTIKDQIAPLRARHSIEATFGAAMPIEKRLALKAQFPGRRAPGGAHASGDRREGSVRQRLHDALHQFPYAGKRALGQDFAPGAADLLSYLISQAYIPEYQVRWRWQPNSVAIWDNRSTQHYAVMDYCPPFARWSAPGSSAQSHRSSLHELSGRRPFPGKPGRPGHHRRALRPGVDAGRFSRGSADLDGRTVQKAVDCSTPAPPVLHLHVREEDGHGSKRLSKFNELLARLRDAVPDMILQVGGSISFAPGD